MWDFSTRKRLGTPVEKLGASPFRGLGEVPGLETTQALSAPGELHVEASQGTARTEEGASTWT
jgi:hypothetical protein